MTEHAIRNKVAIVGYAHSTIERRAHRPLGAVAVDIARAASPMPD